MSTKNGDKRLKLLKALLKKHNIKPGYLAEKMGVVRETLLSYLTEKRRLTSEVKKRIVVAIKEIVFELHTTADQLKKDLKRWENESED